MKMEKYTFQKVADHFKESEEYRTRKGIVHPEEDPTMIDFIRTHASSGDRILEVGGGSGAFLDLVLENTNIKEAYNLELVYEAYKKQVNENICLMGGNALDIPFKDISFDVVVVKNLLHHLVGRTRRESKGFAKRAVGELTRVTKDGGYILILDQYNKHRLFSSIIFYLTLFFSIFSISFKSFGWGENVIVSFLTPDETRNFLTKTGNVEIVLSRENRLDVSKKWKYTLLMSDIGRLVVICRKRKEIHG
jgi:ubiquinone/menaquinone biosynthesis C-methylase UbiE